MEEVYSIKKIKSYTELENKMNEPIAKFINSKIADGFIVCWLHHALLFGKIRNGNLEFINNFLPDFEKYLIKLRAFNEKEELYVWRDNIDFKYRLRVDGAGEEQEYVESKQIIWGTKVEVFSEGFSEIKEERGVKLIVPSEWVGRESFNEKTRLILKTKNYIAYNELGQAGFIDTRFASITLEGV